MDKILEAFAGVIEKGAGALLDSGPVGLVTLLVLVIAGLLYYDNRALHKKVDDLQEKRAEELKTITTLAEKFTSATELVFAAIHRQVEK